MMGMLIQNAAFQFIAETSMPPKMGPSAAAIPPAAPHKPIIFVRFIWSEYISAIKTSELGTTMAAPMP